MSLLVDLSLCLSVGQSVVEGSEHVIYGNRPCLYFGYPTINLSIFTHRIKPGTIIARATIEPVPKMTLVEVHSEDDLDGDIMPSIRRPTSLPAVNGGKKDEGLPDLERERSCGRTSPIDLSP